MVFIKNLQNTKTFGLSNKDLLTHWDSLVKYFKKYFLVQIDISNFFLNGNNILASFREEYQKKMKTILNFLKVTFNEKNRNNK